jgi:hypothetical protein
VVWMPGPPYPVYLRTSFECFWFVFQGLGISWVWLAVWCGLVGVLVLVLIIAGWLWYRQRSV